jgi:hypothetical protein
MIGLNHVIKVLDLAVFRFGRALAFNL